MELPGAVFRDNLTDFGGSGIADAEIHLSDTETDDDPISFRTNETGFFAHGPLTTEPTHTPSIWTEMDSMRSTPPSRSRTSAPW